MARRLGLALCGVLLIACGENRESPTTAPHGEHKAVAENTAETLCPETRPEFCTREYQPVCATRDTGIRCITEPCDSSELKTYSNGCTACSDPAVSGWRPGECETSPGS